MNRAPFVLRVEQGASLRNRVRLVILWPDTPVRELAFVNAMSFVPDAWNGSTQWSDLQSSGMVELVLQDPRATLDGNTAFAVCEELPRFVIAFEREGAALTLVGWAEPDLAGTAVSAASPQPRDHHDDQVEMLRMLLVPGGQDLSNELGPNDLQIRAGVLSGPTDAGNERISVLPREVMAGGEVPQGWAEVARTLGDQERGVTTADVAIRPGGVAEVLQGGQSQRISVLPKDVMAGNANPKPVMSDVTQILQLDPNNVEQWTPVEHEHINGWKFKLQPLPGGQIFTFLAFKSPQDSNRWRVWVLNPKVDDQYGHTPHMINTMVGGRRFPVICGPRGQAAETLADARGHAAKWAIYSQRKYRGERTFFSE